MASRAGRRRQHRRHKSRARMRHDPLLAEMTATLSGVLAPDKPLPVWTQNARGVPAEAFSGLAPRYSSEATPR